MSGEARKRILIVEDDASVRGLMAKHFRKSGYQVSEAADAYEALEHTAERKSFDLVLTDVHLAHNSGLDLARRLHQRTPESPVVFVTGDPDEALAREALSTVGAAGFLLKPFRLFELDAVVNQVLGRNQPSPTMRFDARLIEMDAEGTMVATPVVGPTIRPRFESEVEVPAPVHVLILERPSDKAPISFKTILRQVLVVGTFIALAWALGVSVGNRDGEARARAQQNAPGAVAPAAPAR